jgi:hypothetical protein
MFTIISAIIHFSLLSFNDDEVKMAEPEANSQNLFDISDPFIQEEFDGPSSDPDLISIDQPKTLIEERDEIRPDSPLGILDISNENDNIPGSSFNHLVGPLPPLPSLANPQKVPKIQPPGGWINKVKNTGIDFGKEFSKK